MSTRTSNLESEESAVIKGKIAGTQTFGGWIGGDAERVETQEFLQALFRWRETVKEFGIAVGSEHKAVLFSGHTQHGDGGGDNGCSVENDIAEGIEGGGHVLKVGLQTQKVCNCLAPEVAPEQ